MVVVVDVAVETNDADQPGDKAGESDSWGVRH